MAMLKIKGENIKIVGRKNERVACDLPFLRGSQIIMFLAKGSF